LSDGLLERRNRAFGAGAALFYEAPLTIVRGEGAWLFDAEGRRYVDMYNNVPCVGHGNPRVAEAIGRQQATLNVHSRYLHEDIIRLAERVAGLHGDFADARQEPLADHAREREHRKFPQPKFLGRLRTPWVGRGGLFTAMREVQA
jgi:hypothetical protein